MGTATTIKTDLNGNHKIQFWGKYKLNITPLFIAA